MNVYVFIYEWLIITFSDCLSAAEDLRELEGLKITQNNGQVSRPINDINNVSKNVSLVYTTLQLQLILQQLIVSNPISSSSSSSTASKPSPLPLLELKNITFYYPYSKSKSSSSDILTPTESLHSKLPISSENHSVNNSIINEYEYKSNNNNKVPRPALYNISITIPHAGYSLGIVGPSGSGKSTLLRLLLGLESICNIDYGSTGAILLGGIDITLSERCSLFATVGQDNDLFGIEFI